MTPTPDEAEAQRIERLANIEQQIEHLTWQEAHCRKEAFAYQTQADAARDRLVTLRARRAEMDEEVNEPA